MTAQINACPKCGSIGVYGWPWWWNLLILQCLECGHYDWNWRFKLKSPRLAAWQERATKERKR